MKKITILLLSLFAYMASAVAQTKIDLNGEWQFYFAKDLAEADALTSARFYAKEYSADEFVATLVPSNWAVLGYEEPVYRTFAKDHTSEGLYRKSFTLPENVAENRVLLHFGGVWSSAEVWLNGVWVGRHDSGYTSFAIDVTESVVAGENLLAVRVRQNYPGHQSDTYDDWSLGGIFRDVEVEMMPRGRWIDKVTAVTDFDKKFEDAQLQLHIMVSDRHKNTLPGNYRSPGEPYGLLITLDDASGNRVAERLLDVESHTSTDRELHETLSIIAPKHWTAETPNLYTLTVALLEKGEIAHRVCHKIGFREISTADGVLRVNGVGVKLRGVNYHEEYPDVGHATTREQMLADLKLMKQANINYVRACHYQHNKHFIELCDSMGMYVGGEISLGGADLRMYNPNYVGAIMTRTIETVNRDLNAPSIIYWSVGNEDSFTELFLQAAKVCKAIDPTRPTLLPWNASEELPSEIDILAPHYWTANEYDSLAMISKRPIITTEYVHAYGNYRFGSLEACWKSLTKHPAGAGGAVWMWADQGLKTPTKKDMKRFGSIEKNDPYLRIGSEGWDGITDSYRRPMRDYWEVQAVYCPVYPAEQSVRYSSKKIVVPFRNDYDFISTDALTIDYRLMLDEEILCEGSAVLDAAPHSVGNVVVPTDGLKVVEGEPCYIHFTIRNNEGVVLGRKAVEVVMPMPKEDPVVAPIELNESDERVTVKVAEKIYTFNPADGMLLTAGDAIRGMRPAIWHRLNDGDHIIKNRKFAAGVSFERYTSTLKRFDVSRCDDSVVITAAADYVIDAANSFSAEYTYTITSDGSLKVDYAITPTVQTSLLPIVGIALKTKPSSAVSRWYGLGPDDAYPNKQAAPILGVWSAADFTGTRAARWVDVGASRIECNGYIDRDKVDSPELRIVHHVLGRSEKGRLNYPEYRIISGKTYSGSFTIR
ncbi:MAG: glycoside hydrolase family 2 [Tidjanibacter sp.]|nr:glycoside hydrolase family 2 [Tidjanibacter sp.]